MTTKNSVFIATSIDGYISDKNGSIDWLHSIPNSNNEDMGYLSFTNTIDALVMGRKTFETVLGFDIEWPYEKPVFVLSSTLKELPKPLQGKVYILNGALKDVVNTIHKKGLNHLYIDGGTTIRNFLSEDLIDEMIITTIPIVLGGGTTLFGDLPKSLEFEFVSSKVYLNQVCQIHYIRKR